MQTFKYKSLKIRIKFSKTNFGFFPFFQINEIKNREWKIIIYEIINNEKILSEFFVSSFPWMLQFWWLRRRHLMTTMFSSFQYRSLNLNQLSHFE